jgi:Staphylococcal nuclease homologue
MRRRTLLAALLGSILFPALLLAADFTGRVVGISDGDTISVLHGGRAEKIRLNGIDCPEKLQAFGQRAKQFTSKLVFGKEVTVNTFGHCKYRRTIGEVILPDGRMLNRLAYSDHVSPCPRTSVPRYNCHSMQIGAVLIDGFDSEVSGTPAGHGFQ